MEEITFDWLEYTVLVATLAASAMIGIYFGFLKREKQDTTIAGYLLGGKNMAVMPISMSLACTYVSGSTFLGAPTEVYTYGTQYLMMIFSLLLTGLCLVFITIPVFYKLQLLSLYQYLEMRFDSSVRKAVSFIYTVSLLLLTPLIIYTPGLVLSQVTGMGVMEGSVLISAVCIFYTTIGGLKAVVWTDTLQGSVMCLSLLAVAVLGTNHVGGVSKVVEAGIHGNRFEFFNMDPDPRTRLTFWSSIVGVFFVYFYAPCSYPSYTQRFTALPTEDKAKRSVIYFMLGAIYFTIGSGYLGLVLYAKYKDCDPLTSGRISKADQILPYFVMELTKNIPGLAGAFVAGIISAALSTLSTNLNTVAGTLYQDFVEPSFGKMSERKAGFIMKSLVVVFGTACLGLLMLIQKLGTILELAYVLEGIASGAMLGVFLLAIFIPQVNSKGAIAGSVGSLAFMTWIGFGYKVAVQAGKIVYETKPISTSECSFTVSVNNSYTSAVSLLGIPTEVYTYGSQYLAALLSFMVMAVFLAFVTIPVFYKLQMVSLYQYLEMRYNTSVRRAVSFVFTIGLILYIPIVMYLPGLALNQVSGTSVMRVTVVVSTICIFYTTIGGLKAVVWTDTLQGVIMTISLLLVAVIGTVQVGGTSAIIEAAAQGDRLEFINLDPDPRRRLTFWTAVIGLTFLYICNICASPAFNQRFVALPTMRKAQWSAFYFGLGLEFFILLSGYMGLVIYTMFKDCDPLASGKISRADQILPYFVLEVTNKVPGLAGAFFAGIVSASLSSMSSGLNTVSGTLYSDFIEPFIGKVSERKANLIIKCLVVVFGSTCMVLALLVDKLGTILELTFSLEGVTSGAIFGVFMMGIFFPQVNSKGALLGCLGSISLMSSMAIGSKIAVKSGIIVYEIKPISTSGCNFTLASGNSTLPIPSFGNAFPLFEISGYYFSFIGCTFSIVIGLIVSYLTGPNKPEDVNRDLLSPLIHKYLPTYSTVPTTDIELNRM